MSFVSTLNNLLGFLGAVPQRAVQWVGLKGIAGGANGVQRSPRIWNSHKESDVFQQDAQNRRALTQAYSRIPTAR